MVPKSRGGRATTTICRDCHTAIHAVLTNKELAESYSTPEALLAHEQLRRVIAFIRKQDPGGRVRTRATQSRRGRRP